MADENNWTHSVKQAIAVLVVVVIAGSFLAYRFVDGERERAWQEWQVRLGLIADTRANLVQRWADEQVAALEELSRNPSLKLYLTQLSMRKGMDGDSEPAQLSYLRNLIRATAVRNGFGGGNKPPQGIRANVGSAQGGGLLLLNAQAELVAATQGAAVPGKDLLAQVREVIGTPRSLISGLSGAAGDPALVNFIVPIAALAAADKKPVGVIVGIKSADAALYPLLRQEGLSLASEETLLVARHGDAVHYLSPLADGSAPFAKVLPYDVDGLASAYAMAHAGGFAIDTDYSGAPVLVTSRTLKAMPWVLVQKIDEAEALQDFRDRRNFLTITLVLLLGVTTALLVAAWHHGSSLQSQRVADELRRRSEALQAQWRLLSTITDNIGELLFLVNRNREFVFANRPLADLLNVDCEDIKGQTLTAVLGPDRGELIARMMEASRQQGHALTSTDDIDLGGERRTYYSIVLPLDIPGYDSTVLMVAHDVTELLEVQRKQTRLMKQLVSVLVRLIDLHDPHCLDHSVRTADVAFAIGRVLDTDELDVDTLTLAAKLANLGKIFAPKDLLTKPGELTPDERQVMKDSENLANETLAQIDFDGPVSQIIRERNERMDGNGPHSLQGEAIHIGARIIAVANAFVAMTSDRSYRKGMNTSEAMDNLMQDANSKFDKGVVSALLYLVENSPQALARAGRAALPDGVSESSPL